ncbi:MAG: S8 family serine peptidase [Limnochordia bacterium]|nr:S8 family serine peptidase [Bacillota bacterium]
MKRIYRLGVLALVLSLFVVGCLGGGSKEYSVSGIIVDGTGLGLGGVKLVLEGAKISLLAETAEDGTWSVQGLKGKVTITPTKAGWSFAPGSREVTKANKAANFAASQQEYAASGFVLDALDIGIADVEMTLEGAGITSSTTTAEDGSWSAAGLKGIVKVTPKKEGWFFSPVSQDVSPENPAADFRGAKGEGLTILIDGNGTVRRDEVFSPMSVDLYPRTTQVQLTAEPDFDWFFVRWEGDVPEGEEEQNPIIVTLDDPLELTAVFQAKTRVNGYIGLSHNFPVAGEQMGDAGSSAAAVRTLKAEGPQPGGSELSGETYPENERIVTFDASLSRMEQEQRLRLAGYEILDTIEVLNAHLVRSTSREGAEVVGDVSGVLSVYKNYDFYLTELKMPDDPYYPGYQWHYDQIRLPQAWAVTTGDRNIRVAVIDTGISTEHQDLAANVNLDLGVSFVIGEDITDIEDDHGHGSHVSGTIGAVTNNGMGMAGIMWEVEIIPVRVFDASGRGSTWAVVNGMLYAAGLLDDQEDKPSIGRPADVVNMSLGGPGSEFQQDAVERAAANGVILVAATGNEYRNLISYPAQYDQVIAVGATGYSDQEEPELADYSNTGMAIDVVAPGGGVVQGVPFGYVWSTWPGGYYGSAGTSMATPHVTGVIGLMLANGIPKNEVRDVLHRTSMEIHVRGFSDTYGYGLVNAYWAVNAVEEMRIIQGRRDGDQITAVAETTVPAKGEQFRLELAQGEYQLIAWVDVNGNGVVDTSDYYTETELIEFGYGEGWSWWGSASEVGDMTDLPIPVAEDPALSREF